MTGLQLCASLSSFALFSVVAFHMLEARRPCLSPGCVTRWAATGALYGMVAVGVLWWWMDTWRAPEAAEWHLCLVRTGMAGILALRLLRGRGARERAGDRRNS